MRLIARNAASVGTRGAQIEIRGYIYENDGELTHIFEITTYNAQGEMVSHRNVLEKDYGTTVSEMKTELFRLDQQEAQVELEAKEQERQRQAQRYSQIDTYGAF